VISDPPVRARSISGLNWPGQSEGLTDRESEILALITQGKNNAEAATLTHLSPNTVKSYIRTSPAAPKPSYGASTTASHPTTTASNTGAEGPDRAGTHAERWPRGYGI
jgi:DNA-binding CsgD family transcriptional regulator